MKGIAAIQGFEYKVSLFTNFFYMLGLGGHSQTLLCELKEQVRDFFLPLHKYDRRELFTLSDGGQIYIDMQGSRFKRNIQSKRPILFILPGLSSDSQTPYILNMVKDASARGYDVAVINYRGLAGAKLVTPKLYEANSIMDIIEPIRHIQKKHKAKYFAMGCSMGGNILANALGSNENLNLESAVCF